jgi:hypothetical protein
MPQEVRDMKRVMVQYRVKPGHAAENEDYIRKVFEELVADAPKGLRYASFKQDDGVSFVHFASIETVDGSNPLGILPAFRAFTSKINDRCEEPPVVVPLSEIGAYRFFGG